MATLILTIVGVDRPGLVAKVSDTINAHGGNWEASRLTDLAGRFAGIIEVHVSQEHVASLRAALQEIQHSGMLHIHVETGEEDCSDEARTLCVTVLGQDHPGIIREVSQTLAALNISIGEMESRTDPAPSGGGNLFHALLSLRLPQDLSVDTATQALEGISCDLMVDIVPDSE